MRAGGDAVASIDAFLAAVGAQVPLDDERRLRVRNIYLSHGFTIAEGHDPVFGDGGLDAPAATIHAHAARGVSGSGGALPQRACLVLESGSADDLCVTMRGADGRLMLAPTQLHRMPAALPG